MLSKDVNELLLDNFPELKEKFNETTSWQEGIDTGSIVVYEDVFMPYVEARIDLNDQNAISRIFDFIEKLISINDDYLQNVIYISIFENINDFIKPDKFIKYFKENTKMKYYEYFSN